MTDQGTETGTALSDLVYRRRAELGLALRAFAERCIDPKNPDAGPQWGYQTIRDLERAMPVKIRPHLVRSLAEGLGVPLPVVQDAAGEQFLGVTAIRDPDSQAYMIVSELERHPPEVRVALMAMLQAWSTRSQAG